MISPQIHHRLKTIGPALVALALCCAQPLRADMIELINGDHYRGTVLGMDTNYVDFLSEIQGRVHLPRNKVAQINLHEVSARPVARTNAQPAAATPLIVYGTNAPAVAAAPLILSGTNQPVAVAPASADAVVQQMRQQGIPPQLINQVQEQIFGKASPEASQKFEEIMGGIMSGQVSVQDLRVQAQSAIKQARDAKKDLGGDAGEMLDGYIGILEKFVAESTPTTTPVLTK